MAECSYHYSVRHVCWCGVDASFNKNRYFTHLWSLCLGKHQVVFLWFFFGIIKNIFNNYCPFVERMHTNLPSATFCNHLLGHPFPPAGYVGGPTCSVMAFKGKWVKYADSAMLRHLISPHSNTCHSAAANPIVLPRYGGATFRSAPHAIPLAACMFRCFTQLRRFY